MRLTKDNVSQLRGFLEDLGSTSSEIIDAAETWLEDENDADERRDARDVLEDQISTLIEQTTELLGLVDSNHRTRV